MTAEFDKINGALAVTVAELNQTTDPARRVELLRSLRALIAHADALVRRIEAEFIQRAIQSRAEESKSPKSQGPCR